MHAIRKECTGRSASAIELQGFGIDRADTRAQWDEALPMIPRMWTEDEFSWGSPTFPMPARNVLPKPVQKPHPPLWMSGTQPDSAILAGERGIGFMHFSTSDPTGVDAKMQSYRDAIGRAKPVGQVVNDQFAAFATLFCGEDDEDAARRAGEPICWYTNRVEAVYSSLAGLGPDESYAWYRERLEKEGMKQRSLQELVDRHSAIVGGPERCIDSIRWYESQGVDMMILLMQAGTLKHDDICESLRRFGKEVVPHFSQ
jgi:alkanesulfonate monooxygenase SsuD/methylene tetrahydromethanopterin reductase-like flavin-dependent oxidoreductase (luciferase family)